MNFILTIFIVPNGYIKHISHLIKFYLSDSV